MRFNLVAVLSSLFALGVSYHETSEDDKPHSIQLVTPKDRTFDLNEVELGSMLNNDDFKDRHLVVISIAGPYRQGKSFLLNFFIRYLNAQYKKHDASNWLESGGPLEGFKWRSGQKRETTGIWVWSDIFTHDYEDGRKVAIILMDTQGVFDHQTSTQNNILIFALSIMSSSVQCYNLMQNIKEDDLQHLRLFSEYGRLSLNRTSEKSFQKLLFIVRDWPYADDTGYGWNGTKTVENILKITEEQTDENTALRKQLRQSFNRIDGFLMPSPGEIVAESGNFTGNLNEIDPDFKTYVKILVEELLSPDKLIVKKIGGQELTIKDWVRYLQSYLKIFKGGVIPEAKDIYQMTLEASQRKLFDDSLVKYAKKMTEALSKSGESLNDNAFMVCHHTAKDEIFKEFEKIPKLGDDASVSYLREEINKAVEKKFFYFKDENDMKHAANIKNTTEHNRLLVKQIEYRIREKHLKKLTENPDTSTLLVSYNSAKVDAVAEFDDKVMGDAQTADVFRDRLERQLSAFEAVLTQAITEITENKKNDEMMKRMEQMEAKLAQANKLSFWKSLGCTLSFGLAC
ncbi:atlastin-like isoform X3 [Sitodiplosis mosellana]|uniref:atlastin-like isoform X3 n=1 Tax=Sitodiplosis mosellana TaxID=263140 RepID=UPI002444823B|nr:atlastin-like isoform X3 [Sitodiplosis mosellana]